MYDPQPHLSEVRNEYLTAKGYLATQSWTDLAALDGDGILNDQPLANGATTEVTSFLAQPAVPRNVSIVCNQSHTGNVVFTGKNIRGQEITETLALNGTNKVVGNKAFASISKIVFPARNASGDTVDVGWDNKIGLYRTMPSDYVLMATVDGVHETTRPTVAFDVDEVEKNTVTFNTTPNGSKDFSLVFVSKEVTNYRKTTA